jgi:stage II sporulation protein AA (anti-sigma F factor antagonist)
MFAVAHGATRRAGRLSIGHPAVDGIPVVTVCGETDRPVKDVLSQALPAYNGAKPPRTVADLSGATSMDSRGINVPIAAHKRMPHRSRVAASRRPPGIGRLIELVGLDAVIACDHSVAQAVTA